jgi:superkiller protein 3|tara:strand:+ start:956 stop:2494 length:1539 start_codon:yes stop_codon:yes gene_type:complete
MIIRLARLLLLLLVMTPSNAVAGEDVMSFDGLSPGLAETLRNARDDTTRRVASLPDAASRSREWGRLGMFYHAQHLPYAAELAYGKALAEAEDPRWRYLRAIALGERGELDLAISDYRRVSQTEPDNMAAWYRLGAGLLVKGDQSGALTAFEEARKLAPESAIVLSALADVAIAREAWPQALELLERAEVLAPDAGQLAYKLAMVHRRMGDVAKAREWLARRDSNNSTPEIDDPVLLEVAQMSRSGRFFVKAGEWALERGDHQQALQAFENAVLLAPDDTTAGLALAYALSISKRDDDALRETRRVLGMDPDSAHGWYTLAWLLRTSESPQDQESAHGAARKSLALTEDERTRTLAAGLSMRAGRFAEAAADYAQLARLQPNQAYYRFWLGLALLGSEDCAARRALTQAVQLQKNWGEAHLVLARAEAICGFGEIAQRRVEALLRVKDDVDTRLTSALVELSLGQSNVARQMATAELPHPDARALLDALDQDRKPRLPFSDESEWWLPAEVR